MGRKPSGGLADEAHQDQHQHHQREQQPFSDELAALRARCEAQAREIASLAAALAASQAGEAAALEQLNLQRFKHDLMVDLVS